MGLGTRIKINIVEEFNYGIVSIKRAAVDVTENKSKFFTHSVYVRLVHG